MAHRLKSPRRMCERNATSQRSICCLEMFVSWGEAAQEMTGGEKRLKNYAQQIRLETAARFIDEVLLRINLCCA
jgi:hypothetical protein